MVVALTFDEIPEGRDARSRLSALTWDDLLENVSFRNETVQGLDLQDIGVRTAVFDRCVFLDTSFLRCRFDRVYFKGTSIN